MKKLDKGIIRWLLFLTLSLLGWQVAQATTEMAITVDDVPIAGPLPVGMTRMEIAKEMLAAFKKHHIQNVYGFINGNNTVHPEDKQVLYAWVDDGELLGNHTYTHSNAKKVSLGYYIKDIQKNDPILEQVMGTKNYKYFRYPFLSEGDSPQKRDAIRQYLASQGYQIAPVTVDFADWMYFPAYKRCLRQHNQAAIAWLQQSYQQQAMAALNRAQAMSEALFNRDINQILLIHPGAIDANQLDNLLTAYEKAGVKFITLPEALQDPAYKLKPSFADTKGFTYLYQILFMKGMKMPRSVNAHYVSFPEAKLNSICKV